MAAATWTLPPFSLAFTTPLQTARARYTHRHGFLVKLCLPDGVTGTGECTPLTDFGTEDLKTAEREVQRALARLPHPAPRTVGEIRAFSASIPTPAARHAVELALLDAAARTMGIPLHHVLGRGTRNTVQVNALLSSTAPEDLAREAAALLSKGWSAFKVKVGSGNVQLDVERLAAFRAAAPSAELRIDANGAWTFPQAIHALTQFHRFNIALCEQPTPAHDVETLLAVSRASPIPIAADESLAVPTDREAVLRQRAARILVLKPMVLGGILTALEIAQRAHAEDMGCVVTSSLDGILARAACAHLAAVLPGPTLAAGLSTGMLFSDEQADPLRPVGGRITLPTTPGTLP
jgi:o-succinylbenzoate synthase